LAQVFQELAKNLLRDVVVTVRISVHVMINFRAHGVLTVLDQLGFCGLVAVLNPFDQFQFLRVHLCSPKSVVK